MSIAEPRIDVIRAFEAIKLALDELEQQLCIQDANLPAWFQPPKILNLPSNISIRKQVFLYIAQLEYLDQQDPREILIGPGLIAATNKTLDVIEQLNIAKNNFKATILRLKSTTLKNDFKNEFDQLLITRPNNIANFLSHIGLARLHLKQCYRRIPYFIKRPLKVSWTWANTRSIKKISVQEAELRLNKSKSKNNANVHYQLQRLRSLQLSEQLAIVQDLAPHLRANLVMPEADGISRIMIKGPVPIFYLDTTNQQLPIIKPPKEKHRRDQNREIRKDVKIEPEPFLPTIRAHRYICNSQVK